MKIVPPFPHSNITTYFHICSKRDNLEIPFLFWNAFTVSTSECRSAKNVPSNALPNVYNEIGKSSGPVVPVIVTSLRH